MERARWRWGRGGTGKAFPLSPSILLNNGRVLHSHPKFHRCIAIPSPSRCPPPLPNVLWQYTVPRDVAQKWHDVTTAVVTIGGFDFVLLRLSSIPSLSKRLFTWRIKGWGGSTRKAFPFLPSSF